MANNNTEKEFGISSWSIENKVTVFVVGAILLIAGFYSYYTMPREDFPEVKLTNVFVSTVFPGNTAQDMEKLITTPLEKKLKGISSIEKMTSTSTEDYAIINIEFDEKIPIETALFRVKDMVDSEKSQVDWPTFDGSKVDPFVFDLNISESMPILNVNVQGDYTVDRLKDFAEYLKDQVEILSEIKDVKIRGVQTKEVEIAVDIYKMAASKISFDNVIGAIRGGNVTISGGNIITSDQRQAIRVVGEISKPENLENFVVKSENGAIYLKDIAQISFKEKDRTSYSRYFGRDVVTLDITKRSGKNVIDATTKIKDIIKEAKANGSLPSDLEVFVSNDTSSDILNSVNDLVNNIIFGVLLVVGVLTLFLGFRNSLYVGLAIPMSMLISFMLVDMIGYTMNTMVLFALIMGLGMLVDNGIVLVENVFRLIKEEGMSRMEAAKKGVGEIAIPIIISTATTVAAFVPLGFWPGIMGEFMVYFPVTLSIVLGASLFVALVVNAMLASHYMDIKDRVIKKNKLIRITWVVGGLGVLLSCFSGTRAIGTLALFIVVGLWLYKYYIKPFSTRFQNTALVKLENSYRSFLVFALKGKNPKRFLWGMISLFVLSFVLLAIATPKVSFFPENEPRQIITYIEYPEGTDIVKTNEITKIIEQEVYAAIDEKEYIQNGKNYMVASGISQVGQGAGNPNTDTGSNAEMPHKGKVTITISETKLRNGKSSEELRKKVQQRLADRYPGVSISVEKDANGPPAGYPITIELKGNDYDKLVNTAEEVNNFLNAKKIPGIENLKVDINRSKPTIEVVVSREKAGELGVSVAQVGTQIRRALFGEKVGIYKVYDENYDINIRFNEELRYKTEVLLNQKITFRDVKGALKEVPISSLVEYRNINTFNAIKHKNLTSVVTVYSGVLSGYNGNEVVTHVKDALKTFKTPDGVTFNFAGEMEEQQKQMSFLMKALVIGIMLIVFLLVLQFNSLSKPFIIMLAVLLSFVGVFLGLVIFRMDFIIIMTMMGIISLAGIVVNNGVVLLDYTQLLIDRTRNKLAIPAEKPLEDHLLKEAIVESGETRLRPVLLTAITTVLGLVPLAMGINIDFISLLSEWDPKIYIGGDNVVFWGPLAWTVIYGLTFATFLTLVIVPVTFYIIERKKSRLKERRLPKH